jgi:hypothetical protein
MFATHGVFGQTNPNTGDIPLPVGEMELSFTSLCMNLLSQFQ